MKARQDLVQLFSTFLQIEGDRVDRWVVDPRLRRSMERVVTPESVNLNTQQRWSCYWHQLWLAQPQSPLPIAHLSAYLQEVGYWSAQKISRNFTSQEGWVDLFQTAIAQVHKILTKYDPEYGAQLKTYAESAFCNLLKDHLRQRREADICSDWALLHKLSRRRAIQVLESSGLRGPKLAESLLAWSCLLECQAPKSGPAQSSRKLSQPSPEMLAAIAQLYERERKTLGGEAQPQTPESLQHLLLRMGQAARRFLYPTQVSADANRGGDDDQRSLLDSFIGEQDESLLQQLIDQEQAQERRDQRQQIADVILQSIAQLDQPSQTLLAAYYGKSMTQQQLAELLQIKQYTVSRRLSSLRRSLLQGLTRWCQDSLHITLTPNVIEAMGQTLEDWLTSHYQVDRPSY